MAVSELAALIERCKREFADREGVELTNSDIARRGRMTRQRVHQFCTVRCRELPSPQMVSRLATGLRVTDERVTVALLLDVGYRVPGVVVTGQEHPATPIRRRAGAVARGGGRTPGRG